MTHNSDHIEKAWQRSFSEEVWYAIPNFGSVRRAAKRDLVKLMLRLLQPVQDPLVLEAGCGIAIHSFALAHRKIRTLNLDFSWEMLAAVEQHKQRFKENFDVGRMQSIRGNIKQLGIADNSLDLVFNDGVVEHFLDVSMRVQIYRELARVLKPGGWLVISIPNDKHPLYPFWCWYARTFKTTFRDFMKGGKLAHDDISPGQLMTELKQANLTNVQVEGTDPWLSLRRHPAEFLPLRLLSLACERLLPAPPHKLKLKLGYFFAAYGQKV